MSDTVSHLNVIKGYTRRWGKMTSQIHRLTLHLTGYYKKTQQSRHNAWQQKIENKCLQNDDEKRAFFSISMFLFFPPIMERGGPCPAQTKIMTVIWETLRELCTGISGIQKHIDLQKPRHGWPCFFHGFWGKWNKFCWKFPANVLHNVYRTWWNLGQHHLLFWQQFTRSPL